MNATALVCSKDRRLSLQPVTLPEPGPGQVAIKTLRSGVSVGTEFALIRDKISWGPFPICTGYMGVGIVERVGGQVDGFAEGDLVYYRGNCNMTLEGEVSVSAVSGVHCSHAVSPASGTHGVARLPDGVGLDAASLFVLPAVGLHGVDMSGAHTSQTVLVNGCGPIGLGVVAALAARGCRVVAADLDETRLVAALSFGAAATVKAGDGFAERARPHFPAGGDGFDLVFECSGIPALVMPSIQMCRKFGTFVWQGNYGAEPIPFLFLEAHNRQLTMKFPCDDGYAPCRAAVLRQMAVGLLPWERAITHRVKATDAPAFFTDIDAGRVRGLVCAVIDWEGMGGGL